MFSWESAIFRIVWSSWKSSLGFFLSQSFLKRWPSMIQVTFRAVGSEWYKGYGRIMHFLGYNTRGWEVPERAQPN